MTPATDTSKIKTELLAVLEEKSIVRKQVTLASGKTSNYYIDCRMTSLSGRGVVRAAKLMYPHISDCDLVGGPTLGADPFLGALLYEAALQGRDMDAFIVRKQAKAHGMQKSIEGTIFPGAEVALVEDVVTSGGSVLTACAAVEEAGAKVKRIVCLFDRMEGGRENIEAKGYELVCLLSRNDLAGL